MQAWLGKNLPEYGPSLHFGLKRDRRVSGARRWQTGKDVTAFGWRKQGMTAKCLLRLGPVKKYMRDVRVFREEGREVVRDFLGDRGVETSWSYTCLKRIPERDPGGLEASHSLCVWQCRAGSEQFPHDVPECVSRVRVVLPSLQ